MTFKIPVYFINLIHRTDRRALIGTEIEKIAPIVSSATRIDAIHNPGFGALGCAASHAKTICEFLFNTKDSMALVLEDDFEFITDSSDHICQAICTAAQKIPFSVIQLSMNLPIATNSEIPGLVRIYKSLTTSGYLVSRPYAYDLLHVFIDAHKALSSLANLMPKHVRSELAAIDVAWHAFQTSTPFYGFRPALGRQRASYSDVNEEFTDYRV